MNALQIVSELTPKQMAALALLPCTGAHYRPRDPVAHEVIDKLTKRYSGELVERVTGSFRYYLRPLGREVQAIITERKNFA